MCIRDSLTVVSTIAYKDPFYTPLGKEENVDRVRDGFDRGCQSDHLMIIQAFDAWRVATNRDQFAYRNFLSNNVIKQISSMRNQFLGLLRDHHMVANHIRNSSSR